MAQNWLRDMVTSNDAKGTARFRKAYSTETQKRLSQLKHASWSTLGSNNLHVLVQTPDGEDSREWIALHITDFFNEVSMLAEMATGHEDAEQFSKPGKGFPAGIVYKWRPGKGAKPQNVSAPEYIEYTMAYIEALVGNDDVFPQDEEGDYPEDFLDIVKDIYLKLFRVFAILYGAFLKSLDAIGVKQHLNTSFKHYVFFGLCHSLLPDAKELTPMAKKVEEFTVQYTESVKKGTPKHKPAKSMQPMEIKDGGVLKEV